jgi:hypothetical protein
MLVVAAMICTANGKPLQPIWPSGALGQLAATTVKQTLNEMAALTGQSPVARLQRASRRHAQGSLA